jgi:hypothetical protein
MKKQQQRGEALPDGGKLRQGSEIGAAVHGTLIRRDSIVLTKDGAVGRVEDILIIYQPDLLPAVGVFVYLLLEGRSEVFSPHDLTLRSNNDNELLTFMELEAAEERLAA